MKNLIISLPTEYRGYTIDWQDNPWAAKYSGVIMFYNTDYSEVYHSADSIQEAVELIDEGGLSDYAPEGEAWAGGFADNH
jgi:hypothetical protein